MKLVGVMGGNVCRSTTAVVVHGLPRCLVVGQPFQFRIESTASSHDESMKQEVE